MPLSIMDVVVVQLLDRSRPLKSLSHMLKGKQGRFRQNLLVNVLTSLDVPLSLLVQHLTK